MLNWKKKWFDPSTKRNGHEFQKIYIRLHSAVDSAQWDWGITTGVLIPTYSYYFLNQFGSFLLVCVKY